MYPVNVNQTAQATEPVNAFATFPLALVVQPDIKVYQLLADLDPNTPWCERKQAAQRLGQLRNPEALPGLLEALPADPFWMVRCAIIQALEYIGDPGAIPTLREVAQGDSFQAVRGYAVKAINRLASQVSESPAAGE